MQEKKFKNMIDFDLYQISNLGNIRNKNNNKVLSTNIDSHGYYRLNLCKDNKRVSVRIHQLMVINYLENPDNIRYIEHIEKNKLNNNINNLILKPPPEKDFEKISNKKHNMTEENIKEIEELWLINFPKMKEVYTKCNNCELVYTKRLTPRLKQLYMQGYGFIKKENE